MAWERGRIRYFDEMTTAPTVNDDENDGYRVSDVWIDETNDKIYQCLDASAGAADWNQIDLGAGAASGTMTSVKEAGVLVDDEVEIIDLDGDHFNTSESPAHEINFSLANPFTSSEKTKLGTIEDNATADQTGAEIKAAYEAEANAFTDAKNTKLAGIATGADVTGNSTPQVHKNSHDPEDGTDPLDTAAPSELAGVQAAGEGSSHSLARGDHQHQIQHGIADNHLVTIDHASVADDDYAKFTPNGLEGRSFAEVLSDLSGQAAASFDMNSQAITKLSNVVTTHTPGGAGTATLDLDVSRIHDITMPAGNITIAISNENNGDIFTIRILQDGTGSRTVTWFSTIKWAGGSAPTLTTTANKADTVIFRVTGTDTYDGFVVGQNI